MNENPDRSEEPVYPAGREVFIIRMWPGDDVDDAWRAVAEHVRTGNSIPFRSLSELVAFFEAQLPPSAPGLR